MDPVKWRFEAQYSNTNEVKLIFGATIEKDWHIYSQFLKEGGPTSTHFEFETSPDFELIGTVDEISDMIEGLDARFAKPAKWFEKSASFSQLVSPKMPTVVKGTIQYMACNDNECLPLESIKFSIAVKVENPQPSNVIAMKDKGATIIDNSLLKSDPVSKSAQSSLAIFVSGFFLGAIATLLIFLFMRRAWYM